MYSNSGRFFICKFGVYTGKIAMHAQHKSVHVRAKTDHCVKKAVASEAN